jgi:hypothetical protein
MATARGGATAERSEQELEQLRDPASVLEADESVDEELEEDVNYFEILKKQGVRRAAGGQLVRKVLRPVAPRTDAEGKVLALRYVEAYRPVALTLKEARDSSPQKDFYDPKHGWIRNGTKREREDAENVGSSPVLHKVIEIPVGEPDE